MRLRASNHQNIDVSMFKNSFFPDPPNLGLKITTLNVVYIGPWLFSEARFLCKKFKKVKCFNQGKPVKNGTFQRSR